MFSQLSRASRSVAVRAAKANAVQMRGFIAPTVPRRADFVQEMYLKSISSYVTPAVKPSDAEGQVQVFSLPKTPASPEETNLAENLNAYKSMAVEIEGQEDPTLSSAPAELPDWLETEAEEEAHH